MVGYRDKDFVMMEVPGLLEGAHKGIGLGQEFLRHAERARVYVHLLDGTGEDPVADYHMLNKELEQFNPELLAKPQIIAVNKVDVTEVRDAEQVLTANLTAAAHQWSSVGDPQLVFMSAVTGEGVDDLLSQVVGTLDVMPKDIPDLEEATNPPKVRARHHLPNKVWVDDGVYVVQSEALERLAALADTRDSRVVIQLWREMERRGLARQLIDAGIEAGDTIRIGKVEVEWF